MNDQQTSVEGEDIHAYVDGTLSDERREEEAALHAISHLETFEPRHVGAMQAYLRQSVINRIRDEVRRIQRRPVTVDLPDDMPADDTSALDLAIQADVAILGKLGYQVAASTGRPVK